MLTLRDYQWDQVNGVKTLLAAGTNRPAVVAATGLGKTVDASQLIIAHIAAHPRDRAVVWVHRDELATQMRNKVHAMAPSLRPGIVMGQQRDHDRQVVIASVQTVSRARKVGGVDTYPRRDQIHGVGLQIADECHHAAAPTWRQTLGHFGGWNGVPTIGFTATMSREDGRGLGEIWQAIVERPDGGVWDTQWGVRNGFLSDVRGIRVQVPSLDLSGVHIRAGDLQQEETATAMLDANTGEAIVKAIYEFAPGRRGTVFCPNVATAVDFADQMNAAGIRTGVILGSTPKDERRRIYAAFQSGELQWLTNAMVLTEGWDAPWCDALVIARPTKAPGLYQQMIGRGLRLFPGKQECIVLDVCGVTEVHGLASLTDLSEDRAIKVKDKQSLLEAMDEFEAEFDDWDGLEDPLWTPPKQPVHAVVGTEIDMFGNSRSVWLQTRGGTWFVPAADQIFFLWPDGAGSFHLGMTPKERSEVSTLLQEDPVELEIGMALLEQYATAYAPQEAGRNAPWRQQGPIRPGQKRDLARYGRTAGKTWSAAKAYDELCIEMASVRLDRVQVNA